MSEQLDLSEHDDPEDAARALYDYLDDLFDSPDGLYLYDPTEAAAKRDGTAVWTVAYEGGPFEWAQALLAGESLFARELAEAGGRPQVVGFYETDDWHAEPYYSFDIQFYAK